MTESPNPGNPGPHPAATDTAAVLRLERPRAGGRQQRVDAPRDVRRDGARGTPGALLKTVEVRGSRRFRDHVYACVSFTVVAPLAQTAERLHGKEKVYGSIP